MSPRLFLDPDGAGNTREPTASDRPFLGRGELITCEAGHPCYTVRRTIYERQRIETSDLMAMPFNPRPRPGIELGACMCGRWWVKSQLRYTDDARSRYQSVAAVHVGGGWRKPGDVSVCLSCGKELNRPNDPKSLDCGGDCLACIEEAEAS